jgi:uncharacterized protein (DUF58 family)
MIGIDTRQTMAHQTFTFLAALHAVAWFATARFRPRVALRRDLPQLGCVGVTLRYRLRVRNLSRRPWLDLHCVDLALAPQGITEQQITQSKLTRCDPGEEQELALEFTPNRRGYIHFVALTLARHEPLGLLRAPYRSALNDRLLVLPRRYPIAAQALPGRRVYQHGGVARASSVGDSEEFVGLRDYRPGDPIQRIHWKSFARVGHPVVREYQDEFFQRHALVLDTMAGDQASLEAAVSVAASFAATVDTQESLLDMLFVAERTHVFTVGHGAANDAALLETLACVEPSTRAFEELHAAVRARRGALSSCILVLLAWDAPRRACADELRGSGLPIRVLLVAQVPPTEMSGVDFIPIDRIAPALAAL